MLEDASLTKLFFFLMLDALHDLIIAGHTISHFFQTSISRG